MTVNNYIREQLIDFTEQYRKHFKRTFGLSVLLTFLCFMLEAILLRYNELDVSVTKQPVSLLSYFFHFYSKGETYSIIDLTKIIFVFFVSLFSLGVGVTSINPTQNDSFSFKSFLSGVSKGAIVYLVGTLLIASAFDCCLFKIDSSLARMLGERSDSSIYFHAVLSHLRIYFPLILFSLVLAKLLSTIKTRLTSKRILFLYISLWLFNEFAYEIYAWSRVYIFDLVLMPLPGNKFFFLLESICGVPLFSCFFIGYTSAMTNSLSLSEK